jgi:hypothetical protein
MNTPTPEDIALAKEVNRSPRHYSSIAQMIAGHCAPLRELAEIGRLAVEIRRTTDESLALGVLNEFAMADAVKTYLAKHPKP